MKKPVDSPAEARRQDATGSYDIMKAHAQSAYDDLCALAAELCGTSMATITLVEGKRLRFQSRVGLPRNEEPTDAAFCRQTISGTEMLYVPDLAADPRFTENPLVKDPAGFRFYAGVPLIVPTGEVLGTLCVMDRVPTHLTEKQRDILVRLARNVVSQLELQGHVERIRERERLASENLQGQRRAQRARADFFTRMCHELRTPVIGILGLLQAVRGPELSEQQAAQVTMARQAGDGLLALVNEILDLSALEDRRVTLERNDFDLTGLVDRTLASFLGPARAKNVELKFTVGGDAENWVISDSGRTQQILTNLVGNAVKFTAAGEVELTVVRDGEDVVFTVRDTGPGIAGERLEDIFEPYGEMGLGLPIAKEITGLLGGQITCRSVLGLGTEFVVRLPMPHGTRPNATPILGLRVLVVDDVTINQKVLKAMLAPHQAVVHLASSGEQAVEMFEPGAYDLILMDRYMPGLDGLGATRAIRQLEVGSETHVPILGTSAAIEASERQLFLNAGADDTVAKPMRMDEFWPKVNRIRSSAKGKAA